ncbi:MAG: hypothetical protein F6K58_05100 [Symploca sp. SIO2E9]|nr:hypothetical protein [Symploca sp. SIO2E9]
MGGWLGEMGGWLGETKIYSESISLIVSDIATDISVRTFYFDSKGAGSRE